MAQQDGYWDKERSTSKQIIVPAKDRLVIKSDDFPVGTTEIVYRITVLDENQQLANSLFSLLKAIPDPTGISQGSAGAVFLVSKIYGDDKCNYSIFTTESAANEYKKSGAIDKACLTQTSPTNKDAKILSLEKSVCFNGNNSAIWFAFESKNWLLKQKIVLEVVPWVDKKLSRGWTSENKKAIVALCKTSDLVKRMIHQDDFCACMLEKFQNNYKFSEYQRLIAIEKTKAFKDFGNSCLTDKPVNSSILNTIRTDAATLFNKKKYNDAIELIKLGIVDNGNATALDYSALGSYYLFSRQYDKAIKVLKIGEQLDNSELLIQLNLAHAYLMNDEYSDAKEIYKKFRLQNVTTNESWVSRVKLDFENFRKIGIQNSNFDRILRILED